MQVIRLATDESHLNLEEEGGQGEKRRPLDRQVRGKGGQDRRRQMRGATISGRDFSQQQKKRGKRGDPIQNPNPANGKVPKTGPYLKKRGRAKTRLLSIRRNPLGANNVKEGMPKGGGGRPIGLLKKSSARRENSS